MTNEQLMMLTGALSTIGLVLTTWFLIVKFISPLWKRLGFWVTTWEGFMRDWAGEDERPGRSRVPGVMERLNRIDGELKHKDAVDRIEIRVKEIDDRLNAGDKKFDDLYNHIKNIEKEIN